MSFGTMRVYAENRMMSNPAMGGLGFDFLRKHYFGSGPIRQADSLR
jgi:hypothetical protein